MTQAVTWGALVVGTSPDATPTEVAARNAELFDAVLSSHSGTARPSYAVAGTIWMDTGDGRLYMYDGTADVELVQEVAVPATASSAGLPGQRAYESGFSYVCVAVDTWERSAIATW